MITRYDVCLDGISLAHIDPAVAVLDVQYEPGEISTQAEMMVNGRSYVTGRSKDRSSVTVLFELHLYDIVRRQTVLQQITAWALAGGTLTASDRPGQELEVICDQPPQYTVKGWTEAISIVFTAVSCPYWRESEPAKVTATTGSRTKTMYVPGNVPGALCRAPVDVTLTAGESITSLMVTVGETKISLSNISVSSGGTIKFTHDEHGILSIMQGSTSLLPKRTAASSDDLLAECGKNVTCKINQNASAVFSVRGLWI